MYEDRRRSQRRSHAVRRAVPRRRRRASRFRKLLISLLILAIIALAAFAFFRGTYRDPLKHYPVEYQEEIKRYASEFSLEPAYVASIILAESSYNPDAVSSQNARGLMQLLPSTAEWISGKLDIPFDEQSLFTPDVNIRYGCWYLGFLMNRYDGNMRTATAAYHSGQGRVDEWLQDPQLSMDGRTLEAIASNATATNTYVSRVLSNYEHYSEIY